MGEILDRILGRTTRTAPRALADAASVPTTEAGYTVAPQQAFWDVPDDEKVPELQWPRNIEIYDQMRRTDAQVVSVLRAVQLPIRRTTWRLDPNGADDAIVDFVAQNLDLPILGREGGVNPRAGDRFSWAEHLQLALTCLPFGHSVFEQRYRIAPDDAGVLRAWVHKFGWRPPKTLARIDVAPDGGLVAIEQDLPGVDKHRMEVSRLVVYVNEREGGNWLGQSLLRPAYKFWVLKDRLLKIQAETIHRNGMGVPVVKASKLPDGLDPDEYFKRLSEEIARGLKIAQNFRSGRNAGASIGNDGDIKLLGVEGTLPDAMAPIKYYDEQIGRAVLANFLNLGGDNSKGSYALGETFADFFTLSLQTVALSIADTASKHIVQDLVDLNFGVGTRAPRVVFDEIGSQQRITAQALKELVDSGVITPDEKLERFARQTYGLPEFDLTTARTGTPEEQARAIARQAGANLATGAMPRPQEGS